MTLIQPTARPAHRQADQPDEPAVDATRELAAIQRRKRLPYIVAAGIGLVALLLALGLLAPTTAGLTTKLADVCTAAGPSVPPDAALDCAQAQRGEVPVRAAGVPGLDGQITEAPVTVPPVRPGEPSTVIYPPGTGAIPGALPSGPLPPGSVPVPGPVVTVSAAPVPSQLAPRETVTVAALPPDPETVTVASPPETVTERETVTEPGPPPPAETSTTTVTETVTVTADSGAPAEPAPTEEPPPPVNESPGDPSPAPGPPEQQPDPAPPPAPVSATDEEQTGTLTRLLSFGLVM